VRDWSIEKQGPSSKDSIQKILDPAVPILGRERLLQKVLSEQDKSILSFRTKNSLAAQFAKSFEPTSLLMDW
jgi:hypothetical protein